MVPPPCRRWRYLPPSPCDKTLAVPLIPPLFVRPSKRLWRTQPRSSSRLEEYILSSIRAPLAGPPFRSTTASPPLRDGEAKVVSCRRLLRQLATRRPFRDFLDDPRVAVWILKGDVGTVAPTPWIRAADARLRGERRAVEDFGRLDTAGHDLLVTQAARIYPRRSARHGTRLAWRP